VQLYRHFRKEHACCRLRGLANPYEPATGALLTATRARSWSVAAVVAFAFLADYFIYGMFASVARRPLSQPMDKVALGVLYGGYAAGVLAAAPLFGYLGVVFGLKRSMVCGVVLSAAATLLFAIATDGTLMFVARLLQGASAAATWTAGLSLVAQYHGERRVETMGYVLVGSTAGTLLAAAVGGRPYQIGGYSLPFILMGLMIVIDAGLRVFVLPPDRITKQLFPRLGILLLDRSVLISAAGVGLAAVGWSVVDPFLPAQLDRLGIEWPVIGLIFIVATIVYGASAPIVEWLSKRVPVNRVVAGGTLVMGIALPLLALVPGIVPITLVLCVVSICYAFMLDPASAELADAADRRGTSCYSVVYAVYNLAYSAGMLATSVATAVAAERLSYLSILLCIAGLLLFAAPLLFSDRSFHLRWK